MDPRLAESCFAKPADCPRVLGRRLRPFCLWHSFQLAAFAGGDAVLAYPQLALAADICRLEPGQVYSAPRGLRRRIDRARAGYYARRPLALLAEIERYTAYREQWSTGPRFWHGERDTPCKTPWQLFLAARLVRHGRMSWAKAWGTPLGRALWLATALAEVGGASLRLMTEADERALREAGIDPDTL